MVLNYRQVLIFTGIFFYFCQSAFAISFDEAVNLSIEKSHLIKKSNYDELYYQEQKKTLNRFINISYEFKNLVQNGQAKIDYTIMDKVDLLNINQLKIDSFNYYAQANKAQLNIYKRSVINNLSDAYFGYILNKTQYQTSLENIKWLKTIDKISDLQEKSGKKSYTDTVISEASVNDAIVSSMNYNEQLNTFSSILIELTGNKSEPELPSPDKLKSEEYYINIYAKNNPDAKYYELKNKAILLEGKFNDQNSLFSPFIYAELQNNVGTNNINSNTISMGLKFTGNYNPGIKYNQSSREIEISSNNEQLKQAIQDGNIFIYKIYQESVMFQKNLRLLEANIELKKDLIRRMEEGYKLRYISLIDLLKLRNEYINNLYLLNEYKIKLIKNTVLLEKLVSEGLYEK